MEKFAVDLDKVLDDFEFNEDCAEQIASINAPSNNASASTTKCNLDAPKNYSYHGTNERQVPSLDVRSPMQGRVPAYSNANYQKNEQPQDATDCINHFYLQDYTGDSKLTQKQTVPPYDCEPASLTIHNDISHKFLQKQQNGSNSPKVDNRYDKKLNQPSSKPSVSNVFNSLNEYINAPTGSLEYVHAVSEDEEDVGSGRRTSNFEATTSTIDCAATNQVFISTAGTSNISLPESDVNISTSVVEEPFSEDCQDLKVHEAPQAPTEPVTDNVQDKCSSIGVTSVSSYKQPDGQGDLSDFLLPSASAEENAPPELETKSVEASVSKLESSTINCMEKVKKDIVKCDTEQKIAVSSDVNEVSTEEIPEDAALQESSSKTLSAISETSAVESEAITQAEEPEPASKAIESPKVAQKKFEFSNLDDHTEEDLMKYLSELEEQDKSANPDVVIESEPVETTEDIPVKQINLRDEDAYEAPIFEIVTIGDVPNVPPADLSDKAKMFPVIDYTKDETKNETAVSDLTEKQSTQVIPKDTEASISLQSEKVTEEEEEEEEEEESFDSTTSELPVNDETSELAQKKRLSLDTDVSNARDTQEHETQTRSTEEAPITDVKNSLEPDEQPAQEQIEHNKSDELRSQSTKESTKNSEAASDNTKESSSESSVSEPSDSIEKPNRPQTLDIVVPEGTSEPQAIGSSSVTPSVPAQSDIEPAKDDCQGSSPDALDNSLESNSLLGKQPPIWVPDCVAASCMMCGTKFTMIKRRHHCRACGKVFCSKCSSWKYKLEYEESAELRVCVLCYHILTKAESEQGMSDWSSGYSTYTNNNEVNSPQGRQPNPNNPMEYCSTIPPLQQLAGGLPPPPTVMVPVGVLKRVGGTKHRSEGSKSVMFSDELDMTWDVLQPVCRKPTSKKVTTASSSLVNTTPKRANLPRIDPVTECFVPQDPNSLPPTVTIHKGQVSYHAVTDEEVLYKSLKNDCQPPVMFAINRNLYAYVKITNLNCCVNKICWNVTSRGLACVSQDEVILLIETLPDETRIPKDLLIYINQLYVEAMKGNTVSELGFAVFHGGNLLGSREHAGFLFIRQTLQCLQKIVLPPAPFLVGLLVHRWETPWAKVFPLRLLLRLGAEYRYYPCPLVSVRFRDALYFEIGHTVMKVLADFRNYSYTLPGVCGLTIHLRNRMTDVMFPRNKYDQVIKGLNNSNDHVLAYASNFSIAADSHLVCIQTNTGDESNYQTQAINIQNNPRTVTGASFIVINGALKSSMGLSAKSSIVEDGLMVEIMPEKMEALKAALRNMQDFSIGCGRQGAPEPDETVNIKWVGNDTQFNIGVKSPIDGQLMDGIPSIRVHNGTDYKGTSRFIRWTEVFIINSHDHPNGVHDPVDINKLSGNIAKATCTALVKLLDLLATAGLTKLAVRTTINPDNVGYEAGSEGTKLPPIYMNSLDNELIQVLHKAAQSSQDTHTVLELIFYVLDD